MSCRTWEMRLSWRMRVSLSLQLFFNFSYRIIQQCHLSNVNENISPQQLWVGVKIFIFDTIDKNGHIINNIDNYLLILFFEGIIRLFFYSLFKICSTHTVPLCKCRPIFLHSSKHSILSIISIL